SQLVDSDAGGTGDDVAACGCGRPRSRELALATVTDGPELIAVARGQAVGFDAQLGAPWAGDGGGGAGSLTAVGCDQCHCVAGTLVGVGGTSDDGGYGDDGRG